MPNFALVDAIIGSPQAAFYILPDNVQRMQTGMILTAVDNYWGTVELIYLKANAAILQGALVQVMPTLVGTSYQYLAIGMPNTANLGRMTGAAMTSAAVGQFFFACITGLAPVNSVASIAADSPFGLGAAGQAGALTAGKQIVNARIIAPATTTVVKTATAPANTKLIFVQSSDGWFAGMPVSGAGIPGATVVVDISRDGTQVTLNNSTTANLVGLNNVTGTYNDGVTFWNVANLNRPFAQGQIV